MPVKDDEETGEFWKVFLRLLSERGLSQRDISRRIGISTQGIQRWKKPGAWPDPVNIVALARAIGVPGEWLLPTCAPDESAGITPYATLNAYLESLGDSLAPDEREFLIRQQFSPGDPGTEWWEDLLRNYRRFKRYVLATGATDGPRGTDGTVIPLFGPKDKD